MPIRRVLAVAALLVSSTTLLVPSPALAGGRLSVDKARQTASTYGAEICLADQARCRSFEVARCVRNGPKKVTCRIDERLRKKQECSYKLVVTKRDGKVTGRVRNKGNTCF